MRGRRRQGIRKGVKGRERIEVSKEDGKKEGMGVGEAMGKGSVQEAK